jgi:hypothetical protein
MIKALANVMPRHLLDRRLNPGAELRAAAAVALEEFDDVPAGVPLVPLEVSSRFTAQRSKLGVVGPPFEARRSRPRSG